MLFNFLKLLVLLFIAIWLKRFVHTMYANVYKDPLTKLNNRVYLYFILEKQLKSMKYNNTSISLAVIDIDNFKSINDTYGHLEGDKVLVEVSKVIQRTIRDNDFIVRWGGEEFVLVLCNASQEVAYEVAERVRLMIEQKTFQNDEQQYNVTVSIGVKTTDKAIGVNDFIYQADKLLYKAKEHKNIVIL